MKTKVRKESREAFKNFTDSKKPNTYTAKIIQSLIEAKRPLSRREISRLTGCEIPTLCRLLKNAVETGDPIIRMVTGECCPVTGNRVVKYVYVDYLEV